jgi:3-phosphoshikimate 1-carboxyvinyltransferase
MRLKYDMRPATINRSVRGGFEVIGVFVEGRPRSDYPRSVDTYRCKPVRGPLDAVVSVPGSKSMTNRALVLAALADGESIVTNVLLAADTRLMIEALRGLGVAVTLDEDDRVAEVTGCRGLLPAEDADIFCGNAGTVMRFGMALAAAGFGRFRLDGVPRMRQRPIGGLASALRTLGAGIEFEGGDGFAPVVVHAKGLRGGDVTITAPESSQMISALLMVAPYASRDVLIDVTGGLPSAPYARMTTVMMDRWRVVVIEQFECDGAKFVVEAPQRYQGRNFAIEPDASSASYFLAAPAVAGGQVCVEGLGTASLQGDVRFVEVLERMGCTVERAADRLTVAGPGEGERLRGVEVDLNDMPDTAPALAVVALFAESTTTIRNVANLRVKETDRIAALARELAKLGATVDELPDGLRIKPPNGLTPASIDTYDDHRMAMSFALAGLRCEGLVINHASCCAKTFPDFFERFEKMCRGAA